MPNSSPKHMIEQLPDGTMTALLPASVSSLQELERIPLYKLRDHIASLTCQGYALEVKKLFDDNPQIISLSISNTDDTSDDGRHISLTIEDCSDGAYDIKTLEDKVWDVAEYLNNAVRERSIYDFIDNFIALKELHADSFDVQVSTAYDDTFQDPGAWMRLRSSAQANELAAHTPSPASSTPKSRM